MEHNSPSPVSENYENNYSSASSPTSTESTSDAKQGNTNISKGPLHSCKICKESFLTIDELTKHKDIFNNKTRLTSHISRSHSEKKRYQCKICNKIYTSEGSFKKHEDLHKDQDTTHIHSGFYQCKICGKTFISLRDLYWHVYTGCFFLMIRF